MTTILTAIFGAIIAWLQGLVSKDISSSNQASSDLTAAQDSAQNLEKATTGDEISTATDDILSKL